MDNQCVCLDGWDGEDCEIPICNPVCVHGTCNDQQKCVCENDWTGDACDQPVCSQN